MTTDLPTMRCPRCGAEHPDHDGLGFIAHTKPAYADACGWCSHPSRDGDGKGGMVCGICGDVATDGDFGTPADRPFVVDLVIATCNGCRGERRFPIDPPFRSAEAFIAWQKGGAITACECGYPTADLKLRIAEQN